MTELSHLDDQGRARMVDVGDKTATERLARAEAYLEVGATIAAALRDGKTPKGNVIETARLAGIQAAKQCSALIPLCHLLALDHVDVQIALEGTRLRIETRVRCHGNTGVEMEALTATSVAGLTLYDMLKALGKDMQLDGLRLLEKTGGKSGDYHARA